MPSSYLLSINKQLPAPLTPVPIAVKNPNVPFAVDAEPTEDSG
jgi:hypothetical protein